eukprot:RCo027391
MDWDDECRTPEYDRLLQQFAANVRDLLPLDDINKISDRDMLRRFLVARKNDLKEAEAMLRKYMAWRKQHNVNNVMYETFSTDFVKYHPGGIHGVDRKGFPVYYQRPEAKGLSYMLEHYTQDQLMRWHVHVMERSRERGGLGTAPWAGPVLPTCWMSASSLCRCSPTATP